MIWCCIVDIMIVKKCLDFDFMCFFYILLLIKLIRCVGNKIFLVVGGVCKLGFGILSW